jgi:AmmeMemoRadiSam system protein B
MLRGGNRRGIRPPAVAGTFYDEDAGTLRHNVEELLPAGVEASPAFGAIVPHAGYI